MILAVLCAALFFGGSPPVEATTDDIKAYCARLYESYQLRLVCQRNEDAAKRRLARQVGLPYGVSAEIWAYCGRLYESWQLAEVCTKNEQAAKEQLAR